MLFKSLRMRLMELDMRQSELARQIGVVDSTLSDRMTGKQPFNAWEIRAIANVLGISPEEWHEYFFDVPSNRMAPPSRGQKEKNHPAHFGR